MDHNPLTGRRQQGKQQLYIIFGSDTMNRGLSVCCVQSWIFSTRMVSQLEGGTTVGDMVSLCKGKTVTTPNFMQRCTT